MDRMAACRRTHLTHHAAFPFKICPTMITAEHGLAESICARVEAYTLAAVEGPRTVESLTADPSH